MPTNQSYLAFNAGELTPYLRHRTDFDKQASGAELMENFIAMPFGGVRKRPGTRWVAALAGRTRLESFQFNDADAYMLAFTATTLTIFRSNTTVADTVTADFGDPFLLQFVQINDVVFLTSQTVSPKRLSRLADANWIIEEIPFSYQPFLSENLDETKIFHVKSILFPEWAIGVVYAPTNFINHNGHPYDCLSPHTSSAADEPGVGASWTTKWLKVDDDFAQSQIPAGGTGWILGPAFDPGQLGSYYEISIKRTQSQFETRLRLRDPAALPGPVPATSAPIIIKGKWSFITGGTWDGTVYIERSFDQGTTWQAYLQYLSPTDDPQNFTSSGDEEKLCLMRIRYVWVSKSPGTATLTSEEPYITSRVQITGFPNAPDYTTASFLAIDDIYSGSTDVWRENAFSTFQGYPAAISVYERRLMFAGTPQHPITVWASRTEDLLNFTPGSTEADASILITLAATRQDPIRWIAAQRRLVIGTGGSEWVFGSDTTDTPLSPTNLLVRQYTFFGSAPLPALSMHGGVFFIERQGCRLRELAYQIDSETYDAADLSRLAEHITQGGITQTAWQGNREPALWSVRSDGVLLNFTYIRTEKVAAWSRHTTQGGQFTSVAVLRNELNDDTVWAVVKRGDVFHLEYFVPGQQTTQENGGTAGSYYVDSGVTSGTDGNLQVSTPAHLNGQQLSVIADGYFLTLSPAAGKLTLPYSAGLVSAGLPVTSRLITLPPEIQTQTGMTHGKLKRINSIKLSLYQSYGGSVSYSGEMNDTTTTLPSGPLDAAPVLATGWFENTFSGGYDADMQFEIYHASPYPYTVIAAAVEWAVYEA